MTEAELAKFVYQEARLLDEKRFDEWYELFTDDAYYWVPLAPGPARPAAAQLARLRGQAAAQAAHRAPEAAERLLAEAGEPLPHVLQTPEVEKSDDATGEYLMRTPVHLHRDARRRVAALRRDCLAHPGASRTGS